MIDGRMTDERTPLCDLTATAALVHQSKAHVEYVAAVTHSATFPFSHRHSSDSLVDKQAKKRQLQECLKEIKRLVAAKYDVDTVGSVDALQRVLACLRRSPSQSAVGAALTPATFDDLGDDFAVAKCVRSSATVIVRRADGVVIGPSPSQECPVSD